MNTKSRSSYKKDRCQCLTTFTGPNFIKVNHWAHENGARYCHFCKTFEPMSSSTYRKIYNKIKKESFHKYREQQLKIVSRIQDRVIPIQYVITKKGVEHCLEYLNKNLDFSKIKTFIHDEHMIATGFMCRACLLATLSHKNIKEIQVAANPCLILKKGIDFKVHRIKASEAIFNIWEPNFKELLDPQYWIERTYSTQILYCTSIENYIPKNALIQVDGRIIFSTSYSPDQLFYSFELDLEESPPKIEDKDLHTPIGE